MRVKTSSWGNYPLAEGELSDAFSQADALHKVPGLNQWIPRGLGRSYGDSSLGAHMLCATPMNRLLAFDADTGILSCEGGVSFDDLLKVFVPRGFFLPVTPGTKFITVGGAIASDVHGKNHHVEGSFSRHVLSFDLLTATGEILRCSREQNADVFRATCGGMGLTGFILNATFRMKKIETSFIAQESTRARNLEEVFKLFEASMHFTYSVAWIDCLSGGNSTGRSILLKGEHATAAQMKAKGGSSPLLQVHPEPWLNVPFQFPGFVLNQWSIKAFNFAFYHKEPAGTKHSLIAYDPYYYPLDKIHNWNRIYGSRGFTQYQFVLPPEKSYDGLVEILGRISKAGMGSFLAVLKYFGKGDEGLLSFPMEGYTLALDFPVSPGLFPFLNQLDEIVLKAGGRLYLTKDARMGAEMFRASYPGLTEFQSIRKKLDPEGRLESLQSRRLGI